MARQKKDTIEDFVNDPEQPETYVCLGAVRKDKKRYSIGDSIDLTQKQAAELLSLRAIRKKHAEIAE